jgi:Fe-Mn family superoxide dismutase
MHRLPQLPWSSGALVPQMSAKTLDLHYGKHHAAYVAKLNQLIKGTRFAEMTLEDIVRQSDGAIFNNAAQHWNHSFFWLGLRPAGGAGPGADLRAAIVSRFGSLPEFRKRFAEAAVDNFGSGWTWLVTDHRGSLDIVSTGNADNPLRDGKTPLLACDVWEHAYYLDYQNRRPDYLAAFWALVDWERVSKRNTTAVRGKAPAARADASARQARSSGA